MRVLFVDENTTIGELLQRRFALPRLAPDHSPIEMIIETDYQKALADIREGDFSRYDVVIVESSATGAAEMSRQILNEVRRTPVIGVVLTAAPSVEDCVESMRAGASDYVAKVGTIEHVAQRLLKGLERVAEARGEIDLDALFVDRHFDEFAETYAGRWIAVGRGRLLSAADTYAELSKAVQEMAVSNSKFWRMPPPPKPRV
ncbi:MAG TPA: response regulator [Vicinamibacterales bacterium]